MFDRDLIDVDMSVEEGMRTVVTMDVAVSEHSDESDGLSRERLEALTSEDAVNSEMTEDSS